MSGWDFQYSTDTTDGHDGTWVTIDSQTGFMTWTGSENKVFTGFN